MMEGGSGKAQCKTDGQWNLLNASIQRQQISKASLVLPAMAASCFPRKERFLLHQIETPKLFWKVAAPLEYNSFEEDISLLNISICVCLLKISFLALYLEPRQKSHRCSESRVTRRGWCCQEMLHRSGGAWMRTFFQSRPQFLARTVSSLFTLYFFLSKTTPIWQQLLAEDSISWSPL